MRHTMTRLEILLEADQKASPYGGTHREQIIGLLESAEGEMQHGAGVTFAYPELDGNSHPGRHPCRKHTFQMTQVPALSSSIRILRMRSPAANRISPVMPTRESKSASRDN